ncbi:helix-turn-helix transcriptional regulator [Scytonema sp. NUACC26]|uniref:helix-turn-helix transcriptional regulator n=1 Tax=Scytonema sp. NUACC26 TaxID=3140176 RepID=UPI0034DBA655
MTLILSPKDYGKLFKPLEAVQDDESFDKSDITYQYSIGKGYFRHILLRDSIILDLYNLQSYKSLVVEFPDREHMLEFRFFIEVGSLTQDTPQRAGGYFLSSSGMASESNYLVQKEPLQTVEVAIHIEPEVFSSFAIDKSGKLPSQLQHLIKRSDQRTYERYGMQTPAMQIAVQQIIQCPYQSIMKQMYFESKVWELVTLVVDREIKINQGYLTTTVLKPSEVDRIYHARETLLKHIHNPPSLIELARQVGLNERKLKQGFRKVFDTTVFGYLHDYRMEVAYNLLIERQMNVTEVARKVGYASTTSFSNAFRKKFGVSPKSCQT